MPNWSRCLHVALQRTWEIPRARLSISKLEGRSSSFFRTNPPRANIVLYSSNISNLMDLLTRLSTELSRITLVTKHIGKCFLTARSELTVLSALASAFETRRDLYLGYGAQPHAGNNINPSITCVSDEARGAGGHTDPRQSVQDVATQSTRHWEAGAVEARSKKQRPNERR